MRACTQFGRSVAGAIICALIALVGLASHAAFASPVQREILALYDGGREAQPCETLIHKLAEMPLNYLGYVVRYHDVRAPLPDMNSLQRYRAVLTWFEAPLAQPTTYLDWAQRVATSGKRFIVLGETGGNPFSGDIRRINNLIAPIGLQHAGQIVSDTLGTRIVSQDAGFVGFERQLDIVLPPYPIMRRGKKSLDAMLEVAPGLRDPRGSILVATGDGGGFAAQGYIYYYDSDANRLKWIINPFAFFRRALGDEIFPVPDVTTISGRRLYFSHVDGSGWNNAVQVEGYRERRAIAAEVLEKELIAPYPDLPVTVGLIAGDIDEQLSGRIDSAAVAKRLFALPQVEIASNSYTYPLVWGAFDNSSGKGPGGDKRVDTAATTGWMSWLLGQDPAQFPQATRLYPRIPFNLGNEVTGAVSLTESLAPPGKHVAIYAWSGDDKPFAAAIAATRQAGLRNINGGNSRFNADYPSVAYVSPISCPVGSERQIYSVARNENHYLDDKGLPNYAFANLKETIRNTESPRRLKGIDLYYSVHSAERPATLNSIKSTLESVRKAPVIPIKTSDYAAIADGFFTIEIIALGESRWQIRNRGALQTLRLDDADGLELDLAPSKGTIGENRHEHALYIALDPAVDEPVVALRSTSDPHPATGVSAMLVESRWLMRSVSAKACELNFTTQGYGDGEFVWTGLEPGQHIVAISRRSQTLWRQLTEVPGNQRLALTIPISAIEPVEVSVKCTSSETAKDN
jgi:polysaccharide biosynthesis protein PelA